MISPYLQTYSQSSAYKPIGELLNCLEIDWNDCQYLVDENKKIIGYRPLTEDAKEKVLLAKAKYNDPLYI